MIVLKKNWDKVLNETLEESEETPVESEETIEEAIKDNRINSRLSLQELSKIMGISENGLEDF